jgi:magnesium-protoporphyrin IX monomethyl ester (oxidative) cyclase
MRADPKLLRGGNLWWIRFFLLSVYATMYVRDHTRPAFHAALGVDPTEYDYRVFRITSEITRQVFPVMLDIDDPRFRAGFETLRLTAEAMAEAKVRGGITAAVQRVGLAAKVAATMARLYFLPVVGNAAPASVRLVPAY